MSDGTVVIFNKHLLNSYGCSLVSLQPAAVEHLMEESDSHGLISRDVPSDADRR